MRLQNWDYTSPGYYFVTICIKNVGAGFPRPILGNAINGKMELNQSGNIVNQCWHDLKIHFENIALDYFMIMPDHIHGIIILKQSGGETPPLRITLGHVIGYFKYQTTVQINKLNNNPGTILWQRNYYDHIIRNEQSLNEIRTYINNNPSQWSLDKYNSPNSFVLPLKEIE